MKIQNLQKSLKTLLKIIFFLGVLLMESDCLHLSTNHQYWFTSFQKFAETGIPYADAAWNYCDQKCYFLESLVPNTDFYMITFEEAIYKPQISACYGKPTGSEPKIWSQLIKNSFFEDLCGDDQEDYLALKQKYKVISQTGVGIGKTS